MLFQGSLTSGKLNDTLIRVVANAGGNNAEYKDDAGMITAK
jgi:hypothetical protein